MAAYRRRRKSPVPGWVWLVIGAVVLGVAVLLIGA